VKLSTRPASRAGDDELWSRAESLLGRAASNAGLAWAEQPGAGAFYGPKLEFNLKDGWGRFWQCGTIQLDLVLPGQFGVHFASSDGGRQVPMMLHRALFGSLERFMGILLEQHAGKLAPWLAPEQVRVLPVGAPQHGYAQSVAAEIAAAGIRVDIDASSQTLAQRIFQAHASAVPFAVILGTREAAGGSATIRERGGQNQTLSRAQALDLLRERCRPAQ
jgi:threonyl-tRNA synthetase